MINLGSLKVNPDWASLPLFDRKEWVRVRFGDVVANLNETVRNPALAGIERFIGLEHLQPRSLHVRQWGNIADGTTFTRRCRPGQVLFGKRRAYQRKVAVAEFDAVVSGDIYVLVPKNDRLVPELVPFLCLSERFFQHAVGTSAGSLSPRTNWASLASFEFDLPPLDQQRRIAEILWAADDLSTSEAKVKNAIDTVLQQQIDQTMKVDSTRLTSSNGVTLQAVTTKIVDGVHKRPDYTPTGVPFLTVENLTRGPQIDFQETRFVSAADNSEFVKRAHPEQGDVLVTKDGTLGVARYVDTNIPFSIFVSLALLKPKRELVSGRFLEYYIRSATFAEHVRKRVSGSALKHIHLIDFRSAPFHLIPLEEQIARVERFQVLEAASAALRRTLDAISRLRDSLIAHLT